MDRIPIFNLSLDELAELLKSWDEPVFRARQIWHRIYRSKVNSFDELSDLPLSLRARLKETAALITLEPVTETTSANGDATKALFRLSDGQTIEAVSMQQGERHTVCVSTQAGCSIGCPFCATGQQGFRRHLTAGEIIEQIMFFARLAPEEPVTNIVFMGMGEPMVNYDATLKAIKAINSPHGFNLGARHITISTAGLVPGIRRLAKEELQIGLAVSLHAPTDALRDTLVPLNRRYPLKYLLAACKDYFAATGRRVSFEYALFAGVNDSVSQARELAKLIRKLNCHVNLIPANKTRASAFRPSPPRKVAAFQEELRKYGITATARSSLGADIDAGCGQLRDRENRGRPSIARQVKKLA